MSLSILILAAAASSDSFIIGLNYGCKNVRITPTSNGFISLICFAGTFLSMVAGRYASNFLSGGIASRIGGGVFALLGLWMLLSHFFRKERTIRQYSENPHYIDKDRSNIIEPRESFLIGMVLSANNIGMGIVGGLAGIPVLLTPLMCALFSFMLIGAGARLGSRIAGTRICAVLEVLSALLIFLLGVSRLVSV